MSNDKLERLRERRDQLNARIQKEAAKEAQRQRKERNARLMRWGVVVDEMIKDGRLEPEKWARECLRYLTRKTDLKRALSGPLDGYSQETPNEAQGAEYEP